MLRRIVNYAQELLDLRGLTDGLKDKARKQPRIPASRIARSALIMLLARLGSFNALVQTARSRFWKQWLEGDMPSADSLGRVCAGMDAAQVRPMQQALYTRLKRMKALPAPEHGLMVAVFDGHETHATRRQKCAGCLERTIHTRQGDHVEYYHRLVNMVLVGEDCCFELDAEPMKAGEDEVAAALRLFDRVVEDYPRAFEIGRAHV